MELRDFKFKIGSRDYLIARDLLDGLSRETIARKYFSQIGDNRTWTFSENVGGSRSPKPLQDQRRLLLWQVGSTIGKMKALGWEFREPYSQKQQWTSKERKWIRWRDSFINELAREMQAKKEFQESPTPIIHKPKPDFSQMPSTPDADIDIRERELIGVRVEPDPDPLPDIKDDYGNVIASFEWDKSDKTFIRTDYEVEVTSEMKLDYFYKKMMQARHFVVTRELAGQVVDFISTRALKDGCKAIVFGVSPQEVMVAITKTWPQDSKNELARWDQEWEEGTPTVNFEDYPSEMDGAHKYLGYSLCLAKARIPIFLVGPSGSGKSFMARNIADALELEYGELPLTAGATPSWLTGAETISGYKTRPFVEIYKNGGVFCFEEIDAADPNMLLLVNNALANDFFTNPVTGEEIEKSEDFVPVATANTWGLGANRQFTGRERLDAATLDRWRVGRIEMDYDQEVELEIVEFWKNQAKPRAPKKAKRVARV